MESLANFLGTYGEEVEDAEEESFLLFSQDIPSSNLGFVDSRATTVDITIHGRDYSIHQSPTLLSSSRAGGTTGAVLWKITPLFAEWISSTTINPLWLAPPSQKQQQLHPQNDPLLSSTSTVVELGCGISALTALSLSPLIQHYIATDQEYVHRLFRENLDANPPPTPKSRPQNKATKSKKKPSSANANPPAPLHPNITFTPLDWELDVPGSLKDCIDNATSLDTAAAPADTDIDVDDRGFDLLLSCDCIYNEALVEPFVRTCADLCRLRPLYINTPESASASAASSCRKPTICIIAQQQRSPDVFEAWLRETLRSFRVWRLTDEVLGDGLKLGSGYLVHLLLLRE